MIFREMKAEGLAWNPFLQIGKGWFLVTAGTKEKCNGMTVSWGASAYGGAKRSDGVYP